MKNHSCWLLTRVKADESLSGTLPALTPYPFTPAAGHQESRCCGNPGGTEKNGETVAIEST